MIQQFCNDNFTSLFTIWITFIAFSCFIAVARTYNTMLNRRDESEHPCRVPNFNRKVFSFLPLSMILAGGLSKLVFIILRCVLSIPTLVSIF